MDKIIDRIVRDNPQLDGVEAITATVTREDRTRAHYYIFKKQEEDLGHQYAKIPLSVMTKENGKGRNRHYVVVAVTPTGYEVYDLNKPRSIHIEGTMVAIGNPNQWGFNIPEEARNEPLPF